MRWPACSSGPRSAAAAGLHVERREGLVHQQDLRLDDERLREGHALAHPAGQFVRILPAVPREADAREPVVRTRLRLVRRNPPQLQAETHVVARAAPRQQRLALEEIAGVRVASGERFAEDADDAVDGCQQARRRVEQRRLSAARRADETHELAVGDGQARTSDGRVLDAVAPGEAARHIVERECRHAAQGFTARAFSTKAFVYVCSRNSTGARRTVRLFAIRTSYVCWMPFRSITPSFEYAPRRRSNAAL